MTSRRSAKHLGISEWTETRPWPSDANTHRCPDCLSSFYSQSALEAHMRMAHSHDQPLSCNMCRLSFKDSFQLSRHMMSHSDNDPLRRPAMPMGGSVFMDSWSEKQFRQPEIGPRGGIRYGRRGRRGRRGSSVQRIDLDPPRMSPYSMAAPMQPRSNIPPGQFLNNYQQTGQPAKNDHTEYYCGICGEAVTHSKFSSHALNHFHDVFEVRTESVVETPAETNGNADCDSCQRLFKKVKAIADILEDRYSEGYVVE